MEARLIWVWQMLWGCLLYTSDYCECKMIDTIAREPLWRHLINYRCGTGHSVSFVGNVHEGPHALNGRNTTLMLSLIHI